MLGARVPAPVLRLFREDVERAGLASLFQDGYFFWQPLAQSVTLHIKVVSSVEVEPEALGGHEEPRQPESCVRRDGTLAMYDLIDTAGWDAEALGQAVLSQAEGCQKVLLEYLARVNRGQPLHG